MSRRVALLAWLALLCGWASAQLTWPMPAPALLTSALLTPALLAQDDDDDGGDDDDDDAPPPAPRPSPAPAPTPAPAPVPPRAPAPAPTQASPDSLARALRVGQIWVERSGTRLVAVRVSLERSGVVVASVTLDPARLEPLAYAKRGLAQPRTAPTRAALGVALSRLGGLAPLRLTVGRFAVASAAGPQLPVYWGGVHVAYLTLDARGLPRPDVAAARALAASTLKVRR